MTTVVFSVTHALTTDHDVDLPCESWDEFNDNRTKSQIRRGTKYEFTSDY